MLENNDNFIWVDKFYFILLSLLLFVKYQEIQELSSFAFTEFSRISMYWIEIKVFNILFLKAQR